MQDWKVIAGEKPDFRLQLVGVPWVPAEAQYEPILSAREVRDRKSVCRTQQPAPGNTFVMCIR